MSTLVLQTGSLSTTGLLRGICLWLAPSPGACYCRRVPPAVDPLIQGERGAKTACAAKDTSVFVNTPTRRQIPMVRRNAVCPRIAHCRRHRGPQHRRNRIQQTHSNLGLTKMEDSDDENGGVRLFRLADRKWEGVSAYSGGEVWKFLVAAMPLQEHASHPHSRRRKRRLGLGKGLIGRDACTQP
jgi:hypothetical protein